MSKKKIPRDFEFSISSDKDGGSTLKMNGNGEECAKSLAIAMSESPVIAKIVLVAAKAFTSV